MEHALAQTRPQRSLLAEELSTIGVLVRRDTHALRAREEPRRRRAAAAADLLAGDRLGHVEHVPAARRARGRLSRVLLSGRGRDGRAVHRDLHHHERDRGSPQRLPAGGAGRARFARVGRARQVPRLRPRSRSCRACCSCCSRRSPGFRLSAMHWPLLLAALALACFGAVRARASRWPGGSTRPPAITW